MSLDPLKNLEQAIDDKISGQINELVGRVTAALAADELTITIPEIVIKISLTKK